MPRMKLLSSAEQKIFGTLPNFTSAQHKQFLDFQKPFIETARALRKPVNCIGKCSTTIDWNLPLIHMSIP